MTNTIETKEKPVVLLDAGSARPWPIRILTFLLIFQALGLIGLSIFNYNPGILQQENLISAILTLFTELTHTLSFGSLALLAIFAAFGFHWLWRTGWPTAMLVQGLSLLVSIGLYIRSHPPYIFGVMAYCILMVIYLHHPDVQQAFQTKQMQEDKWPDADLEEMV